MRAAGATRALRAGWPRGSSAAAMATLLLFAPVAQAQVQNGGFETGNFSSWTIKDYNRSGSGLPSVPPTSSGLVGLPNQLDLTKTGADRGGAGDTNVYRTQVLTSAGTAANTGSNGPRYPFSGNVSARVGGSGSLKGSSIEQTVTMALSDVDPVDGKVHIRFAMAPVLNDPNHAKHEQPYFFVEVVNLTKNRQLFQTFNYANQPGIPWQNFGDYKFTNWQGFDIAPGNGQLDVGDQVLLKIFVANCSPSAAAHTAQVYLDVVGSKMPGLTVAAAGPSTTKPGEQVTYTYNYVNNTGVYALGSMVRLAAPFTEDSKALTFVSGSYPASCSAVQPATTNPLRGAYIECPVGDLVAGDGGSFNVTFTVPANAETNQTNAALAVINNGDYDIRANTVSPFIGPLVKTNIVGAATSLVDMGITVGNGGVPSYLQGNPVAYTVTVTNNGPIDVNGAAVTQILTGVSGTAAWTCAPAPGSTATCGAASGTGPISTTGSLPVGQSLVYTVTGITATAAGTPVVTVVNVAPPAGMSDSVAANNTDGLSTPVSDQQHTLTVNTTGAGTGKVTAVPGTLACASPGGTACRAQLLGRDQEAYLSAVADSGSIFKHWITPGDCTSVGGDQCHVRMGTQDLSVTAVFAKVWMVTPSIVGGSMTPVTPQVVEEGQGTSFSITPGTPGQVPVISTPTGANTCPGTLTGPSGGNYTWSVSPVTEDCAFHVTFVTPDPKLTVTKSESSSGPYTQGDVIDYAFLVKNTGNVALTGILVNDARLDAAANCPVTTLAPDAETTCTGSHTVTAAEVAVGLVHNSATATGTPPTGAAVDSPPSEVDIETAQNPGLTIVKSVTSAGPYAVGDVIDYQFVVTNTGDVNLSGIVVHDAQLDAAAVCAATALAPTASTTCTGSHTVTAAEVAVGNVHNSATASGTPPATPGNPTPTPVDTPTPSEVDTPTVQNPGLTIVKSVTSAGPYTVGDVIDYQFVVTNTGDVNLSGIVVHDGQLDAAAVCAATTLAPTASTTCTGSHTVTAADVDAGNVHNSATASGTPPVTPGNPTPTPVDTPTPGEVDTPIAQAPSLTIAKSVTSTGPYTAGSTIAYAFLVTNTGDVTLSNVAVTDPLPGLSAVACPATTLAPSADMTCTASYTVTAADVDAGNVHNSVTAQGTPPVTPGNPTPTPVDTPTPSEVNTPIAQAPGLSIGKSVTSAGPYTAGSTISYAFLVTNTGDVTLSDVAVTDPLPGLSAVACPATTLASGADMTCTASYTVTAADVEAGNVHNSAMARGTPPATPTNPAPAPINTPTPSEVDTPIAQAPGLSIAKSVTSTGPYTAGSTIAYAFLVTNTGDVTLSDVAVTDPLPGLSAVTCPATTLAPGTGMTCTASYTVTAADVEAGNVHNSAMARGTPPVTTANPTPTPINAPTPGQVDTPIAQAPGLSIGKSVTSTSPYAQGSTIAYAFLVTNTGDVTLSDVAVTDPLPGLSAVTCPATTLAPGTGMTCTASYTVTAADVDAGNVHNSATASGTPPATPGNPTPSPVPTPTPGDVDTPITQLPGLTVVKTAVEGSHGVGDAIAYRFVVTNTGNVTLSDIQVNDALLDAPAACPVTMLAAAASTTCTGAYTVTQADVDVGSVHNVATATATPPGASAQPISSEPAEVTTPIAQHPAIVTAKTAVLSVDGATPGMANIGDVITYAVTATNTGNVTLADVAVEDTLDGYAPTLLACVPTTLAPGETATCASYDHTVTVADANRAGGSLDNRVEASATALMGGSVSFTVTAQGNAMMAVEPDPMQLRMVKTASPRDVKVGDLVRYTLSIQNTGTTPLVNGVIVDTPPAGFSYVEGSLVVRDADNAGRLVNQHPLDIDQIDIPAGHTATVAYLLRVGAGVRPGIHSNSALVRDSGEPASNVATADVQLTGDPMLDESLILGTVFDDRDGDGWQDSAALSGVRVQGGFAPGAYVANSTTVDRGNGPQPEADASSPLLHGIAIGAIAGRESDADPAVAHRVVVSQTLASLDFTDGFVLTSDEGVSVRMDAAGGTTVERTGKAAKGLTAAAPSVARRISRMADGYRVDYVIRNEGVDERGIPGVRIASLEGLLVETDQFGRYHLAGIEGGRWERGRNFMLKVDPATLPPGSALTTDNPQLRRVTPGLPVRFDFGVKLPPGVADEGRQEVELELGEVMFDPGSAALRAPYLPVIEQMAAQVRQHGAGEVVISANGGSQALAYDRAKAVREALLAALDPELAQAVTVSLRTDLADPRSTLLSLGQSPLLGTVLFDTDKSAIKPEFAPVIERIAADIERLGGGTVGVVGHADRRGSDAYNLALGLRRANAVHEAIASLLSAEARSRLRVEVDDDPTAPVGPQSHQGEQ
ncbi:hypothetical protein WQ53_04735 [Pseudoxanthomonas suwonensis]|uniref:OmpA-like domain-containing protein n=2 Tax=Pseudoxanthomonas suwonensis TaxID=314722 RepID=A0A0E3YZW9_9GAMM|nr:hypothetical protein WQ53_04735 [Pseudoxanthomonas suwonensis]